MDEAVAPEGGERLLNGRPARAGQPGLGERHHRSLAGGQLRR
jgi:hypothetical protein